MGWLQTLDAAIGAACRGVLYLTLAVVFVILSVNVGLRYVAGTSLASASELPELLFPWMIMAGVVLAAQHGSHIAVVILTQKLAATARRLSLETLERFNAEYETLVRSAGVSGAGESTVFLVVELLEKATETELQVIQADTAARTARAELWRYASPEPFFHVQP